jgi:hypothetical protein
MPLYLDTPGLRFDQGHRLDQLEDFVPPTTEPVSTQNSRKHRTQPYRMNNRQRAEVQRLIRVKGFCASEQGRFNNTPAKAGDAKFTELRASLVALRPQITRKQAVQAGGGFHQATAEQAVERLGLLELLRSVNRTVAAIAETRGEPGLMDRFRLPHGNNDTELATTGDAFATAITELNLAPAITDLGYEGDIVADLTVEAEEFRISEEEQGNALGDRVGATGSLPGLLKKGRTLVKSLDALIKNRFPKDAALLAKWTTAKHVTAAPSPDDEEDDDEEPTPPPAPPVG